MPTPAAKPETPTTPAPATVPDAPSARRENSAADPLLNPDAPVTQQSVAGREMHELEEILSDPATLARNATEVR